jgi:hypothetical protein
VTLAREEALQPDRHCIPLEKDFSNVKKVLAKIANLDYIEAMTSRAYDEIIGSKRYLYATFVDGVDLYLEGRCPRGARVTQSLPSQCRSCGGCGGSCRVDCAASRCRAFA